MKKTIAYFSLFLLIFISACKKDNNNPTTGSSTGTYFPMSAGTYWKYKDSATGTVTTTTVLSDKKTIDSRSYTAIQAVTSTGTDTVYAAVDGPNYYYSVTASIPGTSSPATLLLNYLNDTASAGYSWQNVAGTVNGSTITVKTTIVEKNIQVSANGQTFNNVVHTRLDLSTTVFGSNLQLGAYDFFISKGVGIVRIRENVGAFGSNTISSSTLTEYHIQ